MRTSLDSLSYNAWEVFPRKIKFISSIDKISVFNEFLAIQQRVEGKNVISAINFKSQKYDVIKFPYDSYWADISEENEFKTNSINISFSSIIQPPSLYNYNLQTKSLKMVAQENEDFPTNDYQIKKIYAKSRDGVAIPISYAYKKGQGKNRPVLLYTYGCFGQISDPNFNYIWPSLLKRNINIAIAHVRGGGFLGPKWQNEGRLLKKKNSINDYIHCAEFLIKNNYSNKNIIGFGRSGGGAIVGSAINQEPELFTIAILDVPFVDVLTSQLDESLSLTKNMKSEWGDPNQIEYYNYIFSYSPYDNIKAQTYPALFVTGAYKDVQVPYYIPAKYVAKLRELKIDNKPLLLWTDFNAGHGGETGRYRTYEKYARLLTFICKMLNIKK
jgi:oligopeptidase B